MSKVTEHFGLGNSKLPRTTAIFNITPAHDCPSAKLGLCQVGGCKGCYAHRSEKRYKQVLPFRMRQAAYWDTVNASEFVADLVEECSYQNGRLKFDTLRVDVSGDFRNQADLWKAERIARILWNQYGVVAYCYTARSDLNYSKLTHLVVNTSGWTWKGFNRIDVVDEPTGLNRVCVGDCKKCNICTIQHGRTVEIIKH